MKLLIKLSLAVALFFSAAGPSEAQGKKTDKNAKKIEAIKQLIQSNNYVFRASYMYPLSGGQQYLTSPYDLTIGKDTVEAFLPYFGVAYFNVGYNNISDAGVKFTSTNFDYSVDPKKNGGYSVRIKPKDTKSASQLYLDVSNNGYASLSVQSVNRQVIRFSGDIIAREKPKS